ncbi:hypothetical protein [Cupriavidus nantongensis]|uniref:hypothetical protein n=1 Tax=Cupriavidus nantongensis TaxID=1796606 RepID=UPI0012373810|nr:hypothetical protein [Cupriavidus nantongensis]
MNASAAAHSQNHSGLPFVVISRENDGEWYVRMVTDNFIVALTEGFTSKHEAIEAAAQAFPGLRIDGQQPIRRESAS